MAKYIIRALKTVYSPDVEIEGTSFNQAALLGLAKIQHDYPNWTDRINEHHVIDLKVRILGDPPKNRTVTLGGRPRARTGQ